MNPTEILSKILPFGAEPDQFYEDDFKNNPVLIFLFEIEQSDSRNDLASIGFILEPEVLIDELKIIIKKFIDYLQANNVLTFTFLENHLDLITDCFNKQSVLKVKERIGSQTKKLIFDIPKILQEKQFKLTTIKRKSRGNIV